MQIQIIVHQEPEGLWAEVPSIPGCVSQGDSMEELLVNIQEAGAYIDRPDGTLRFR
jgi:predicted RNase H-like HicB family nuclease